MRLQLETPRDDITRGSSCRRQAVDASGEYAHGNDGPLRQLPGGKVLFPDDICEALGQRRPVFEMQPEEYPSQVGARILEDSRTIRREL